MQIVASQSFFIKTESGFNKKKVESDSIRPVPFRKKNNTKIRVRAAPDLCDTSLTRDGQNSELDWSQSMAFFLSDRSVVEVCFLLICCSRSSVLNFKMETKNYTSVNCTEF